MQKVIMAIALVAERLSGFIQMLWQEDIVSSAIRM